MKQKLVAGAELDLLTEGDLRAAITETISGFLRAPEVVRDGASIALTSGGAVTHALVYAPPAGMEFALTRFVIDLDATYTPGNPYTNTAGWLALERASQMQDFVTFGAGIPAVYTETISKAIRFRDLESLTVSVTSGPASATLNFRFQGFLYPVDRPLY